MDQNKLKVIVIATLSAVSLAGIGGGIYTYSWFSKVKQDLPSVEKLMQFEPAQPTVILSRNNEKIGEIFEERRYPVKLNEISKTVLQAFLAAEDARFYEHSGVDIQGFMRGAKSYITRKKNIQGGSTITQQLAKSVLLTKERTLERKLKDILLAFEIEKKLTKDQILELYLNTIFLGNNSYGVEAAARNYFRKTNQELTLAEAAMIAGVNSAPSAYAPTENLVRAKQRQRFVLEQMVKHKWATVEEAKKALAQPLKVHRAQTPNTTVAPYFFIDVRKQLENQLKLKNIESSGYVVQTTIDTNLQALVQHTVTEKLKEFEDRRGYKGAVKRHGRNFTEIVTKIANSPIREDEDTRAIVVDIFPNLGAAAIVSAEGVGLLLEDDHRWALSRAKSKDRSILDFANIIAVGDEVHVKQLKRPTPPRVERQKKHLESLNRYFKYFETPVSNKIQYYGLTDTEGVESAVVVMDARNGDVLAMVGGAEFRNSQFNRATQAKRQVGSSVKPLYYSYAIDQGFSPASKIASPPIVIGDWKPENYSKEFTGTTTLRTSLINSFNISSIQLFQALGPSQVVNHFKHLGLDWPKEDLSIALGAGEATLLQMVRAYSPFSNEGRLAEPRYITKILSKTGEVLYDTGNDKLNVFANKESTQVEVNSDVQMGAKKLSEKTRPLSAEASFVTVKIMQDIIRFGTGTGAAGVSPFAAGKTGTTNGYTDAWFMGVVPHLVTGVWVGFDDARKSLGTDGTGGKMAAPIWREVMKHTLQLYPTAGDWSEPSGISYVKIDSQTGDIATGGGGIRVPLISGTEPNSSKARNANSMYDLSTPASSEPGTPVPDTTSTSDELRQQMF